MRKLAVSDENLSTDEMDLFEQICSDYLTNNESEDTDPNAEVHPEALKSYWVQVKKFKHALYWLLREFLKQKFKKLINDGKVPQSEFLTEGDEHQLHTFKLKAEHHKRNLTEDVSDEDEGMYYSLMTTYRKKFYEVWNYCRDKWVEQQADKWETALFDEAKALYLCYMTLSGEGVGIWDGSWDFVFSKEEVTEFRKELKKLKSQHDAIGYSLQNMMWTPEDDK